MAKKEEFDDMQIPSLFTVLSLINEIISSAVKLIICVLFGIVKRLVVVNYI